MYCELLHLAICIGGRKYIIYDIYIYIYTYISTGVVRVCALVYIWSVAQQNHCRSLLFAIGILYSFVCFVFVINDNLVECCV